MHGHTGLDMARLGTERTRSITAENPTGEPGAGGTAASDLGPGRKGKPCITLPPGEETTVADIEGPGELRHLWFTVRPETDEADTVFRDLILRMYWDDESSPSVEVPLGDFFCCGHGIPADVDSVPIVTAPVGGFNSFFSMPFADRARITVEADHPKKVTAFFYQIDYALLDELPEDIGYFHAQWRRENPTTRGEDMVIVEDLSGPGKYVGTYLAWAALEGKWWGEGEVKFYLDGDEEYPTICGTGAEDYVGGAWGFAGRTFSTPYLGYHQREDGEDQVPKHGLYRWHLPDPIYFDDELTATVQVMGNDGYGNLVERVDDVASVAYWYQREPHEPFPALPQRTDRRPR